VQMVGWCLAHLHLLGKQRWRACVSSPSAATVSALIDRSAVQFAAAMLGTGRHSDERRAIRRTPRRIVCVPLRIAPNARAISSEERHEILIGNKRWGGHGPSTAAAPLTNLGGAPAGALHLSQASPTHD
jgi:hypothetical protein